MHLTLQYIIIFLLFIAAIVYVGKRFFPGKKKAACGGCSSCAINNTKKLSE